MPETTLEDLERPRQDVTGLWGRRAFLAVLTLVLVAAFAGLAGTRTATTERAEGDGWGLQVEYASIARAGLDVPFTVTVSHDGGLGDHVTLAVTGTYLDIFETQGFHPEPSASTREGDTLYLTFDAPPSGDTFRVSYDAYIQPAAQVGRSATVSVVSDGRVETSVDLRTWLWP